MKFLFFLSIFTTLIAAPLAMAEDSSLHSFVSQLDSSLRHINRSEVNKPCAVKPLLPTSAQTTTYQGQKVTVLSEQDAQELFKEMQAHTEIPFDFAIAGCEERAHEMSRLMMLKGITPLKGFASVNENDAPRLKVPHPTKPGKTIEWKYHVAPVVLVQKDGKLIPYSVDPSIEKAAVPTTSWLNDMTRHDPKMKVKMEYTAASRFDVDGRIRVDPANKEFTKSNQESLQQFKKLSKDPDGEDEYLFQLQRDQERMDMIDGVGQ
ncbi:protein-glutamine glutaminase family protein [Bdellovibrio sp. NC01]|uniref:protein-glutamine glutaminase family protein n=1 Tax=Bdellovibrio sp. NC01 TaxID=2220073 RepID=UPI00115A2826|nr:protein-glutamine glutaminase family protein [Bdellovibrio sp. NC01]QDK38683.1 hypothetical protein DOE51_14360 [Bdellovibrio sp. NC01]